MDCPATGSVGLSAPPIRRAAPPASTTAANPPTYVPYPGDDVSVTALVSLPSPHLPEYRVRSRSIFAVLAHHKLVLRSPCSSPIDHPVAALAHRWVDAHAPHSTACDHGSAA